MRGAGLGGGPQYERAQRRFTFVRSHQVSVEATSTVVLYTLCSLPPGFRGGHILHFFYFEPQAISARIVSPVGRDLLDCGLKGLWGG